MKILPFVQRATDAEIRARIQRAMAIGRSTLTCDDQPRTQERESEPAVDEVRDSTTESNPTHDQPDDVTVYSIRVPVERDSVTCGHCAERLVAGGPTGYADDQPICDVCLLNGDQALGSLMTLMSAARIFAIAFGPEDQKEYAEALREIGSLARILERIWAKDGPPRIFRIPRVNVTPSPATTETLAEPSPPTANALFDRLRSSLRTLFGIQA